MPNRQTIQLIAIELQFRYKPIHQFHKPPVVSRFEQMHHLMHDDVFEALAGLFREFGVEADAARTGSRTLTAKR